MQCERNENRMKVQVLASVMNQKLPEVLEKMQLASDAVIINQCDRFALEETEKDGCKIKFCSFPERGVEEAEMRQF